LDILRIPMAMRFETPPPEPLASAPGFLLSFNGQRMARSFAMALEPLGLRPPHFGVLRLIDTNPGSAQRELVERSMIDASSMVALIDELEALGLAERRPHLADRRKRLVYLTPKGRRALQRAQAVAARTADEMFSPLTDKELETLTELLRRLAGIGD
jgi:MarR family transcriptional regulator, lower aerobic nicotinate degradation pathway regulator